MLLLYLHDKTLNMFHVSHHLDIICYLQDNSGLETTLFCNAGYSNYCIAGFMYPMHDITELYLLLNELINVISNLFIGERFSLGVGE